MGCPEICQHFGQPWLAMKLTDNTERLDVLCVRCFVKVSGDAVLRFKGSALTEFGAGCLQGFRFAWL